jgi:hypothetical protein
MAVDTSALAAKLDAQSINKRGPAAAATAKVRGYLDIPGERGVLDPNPAALHETRQAIDGLLDGETNRTVRYVLGEARKDVDRLLASSAPGVKADGREVGRVVAPVRRLDAARTLRSSTAARLPFGLR